MNSKPMLNAYPDSLGGNLGDIVTLLKTEALQNVFSSFYILPSLYHSDLDRGFSVIDYDLNEQLANREDLDQLKNMGIDLKLDFILNHASAQSPQFRDLVEKGEDSAYRNFFIDWNHFWEGHGTMTEEGYIQPDESCLKQMFFRKPGLPILMVEFPDGKKVPYWNTFYQEVHGRQYLGQMDVNIQSPKVWEFYRETLEKIASYGAAIVRLDAFAYAPKAPGKKNFLNDPETWELLQKIHVLAEPLGLTLLPEIHAAYDEKIYETLAEKGYATYDFFLPGLVIDAIENRRGTYLAAWAKEIVEKKPGMLDFEVEQGGKNLSGGQKQRLTIARALVKKPRILILDDSSSALDFATDAALRKAIHALPVTTFIVSQRIACVMQADLILVLDDGVLAGKGVHSELMTSCPLYQDIYYSQFPEERNANAKGAMA